MYLKRSTPSDLTRATARTARPRKHNTARGRSPPRVLRRLQTQHRPQQMNLSMNHSSRHCPVDWRHMAITWRDVHFLQGASHCAPLAHNRSLQAVRTLSLTMSSIMSNPDGSCSRALPIIPSVWAVAPISELSCPQLIPPSSLTTPTPVELKRVAHPLASARTSAGTRTRAACSGARILL